MPGSQNKHLFNLTFTEFINTFSVFVILGVPICYIFFAELFGVQFKWEILVTLGLSVFSIYTIDHVLDGLKWKDKSVTLRHFIHYKYRKGLTVLAAFSIGLALFISYTNFDKTVLNFGYTIAAMVLVYFVLNFVFKEFFRTILFTKEFIIAIVVSACFVGLPVVQSGVHITKGIFYLFGGIVLLNFSNLISFSYFDYESDKKGRFSGISKMVPHTVLKKILFILLIASIAITLYGAKGVQLNIVQIVILLVMHIQLLVILLLEAVYLKNERYRFWGDIIYIYPLVYFFVS